MYEAQKKERESSVKREKYFPDWDSAMLTLQVWEPNFTFKAARPGQQWLEFGQGWPSEVCGEEEPHLDPIQKH